MFLQVLPIAFFLSKGSQCLVPQLTSATLQSRHFKDKSSKKLNAIFAFWLIF